MLFSPAFPGCPYRKSTTDAAAQAPQKPQLFAAAAKQEAALWLAVVAVASQACIPPLLYLQHIDFPWV